MKVKFYGTRGSMPIADPDYVHYGGNTSSVLVTFSTGRVAILDAGTGIRNLGNDLIKNSHEQFDNINIILSHTHWDHIQGFPYFEPAYDPRRNITIGICGKERMGKDIENLFSMQMQNDFFPVPLEKMGAKLTFLQPDITEYEHQPSGVKLFATKYSHRGDAYGYRIEEGEKTLVYCTDVEHKNGIDPNVVELSRNADLLIHDAQYTPEELKKKRGWGHSSWEQAIEVAKQARVKQLALFHHDPEHNDTFLSNIEKQCRKIFPNAFLAKERDEIEL
jgi:phosphoribosyl 1,2-cyclic phosphodiesterase